MKINDENWKITINEYCWILKRFHSTYWTHVSVGYTGKQCRSQSKGAVGEHRHRSRQGYVQLECVLHPIVEQNSVEALSASGQRSYRRHLQYCGDHIGTVFGVLLRRQACVTCKYLFDFQIRFVITR